MSNSSSSFPSTIISREETIVGVLGSDNNDQLENHQQHIEEVEDDYNQSNSYGVSSRKRFDQMEQKQPLLGSSSSNNNNNNETSIQHSSSGSNINSLAQKPGANFFDKLEDKKVSMSPLDGLYESKAGFLFLNFAKYCMRIFGLAMVLLAVVLLSLNFYFFFTVTLPMMNTQMWTFVFHLILGIYIAGSITFNYVQCVRVNPGNTPKEWLDTISNMESFKQTDSTSLPGKKWSKWCGRCQQPKPSRAHHCHICDVCILRMDHHCPWLNNCVGIHNHKHFVGFIGFLAIAALYNFGMIALGVFGFYSPDPILYAKWNGWLTFVMVLCGAMGVTMSTFTSWHIYLVLTNQTTIEFQFNKMKLIERGAKKNVGNIYDMGIKENVQQVYGAVVPEDSKLSWAKTILLPNLQKSTSDGVNYPTNEPKNSDQV